MVLKILQTHFIIEDEHELVTNPYIISFRLMISQRLVFPCQEQKTQGTFCLRQESPINLLWIEVWDVSAIFSLLILQRNFISLLSKQVLTCVRSRSYTIITQCRFHDLVKPGLLCLFAARSALKWSWIGWIQFERSMWLHASYIWI